MTVKTEPPLPDQKFVNPDGTLTVEGLILLQQLTRKLDDHEERLVAGGH